MIKKRGRPLCNVSIEKNRIKDLLTNIPNMSQKEYNETQVILKNLAAMESKIIKDFKHAKSTPVQHAYEMASIYDESFEGYRETLIDNDKKYKNLAKQISCKGGRATRDEADRKAQKLTANNQGLINQLKPNGKRSLNGVSKIISNQWVSRGYDGKKPSERTIRNLLMR
jgi:hypothetical protein